VYLKSGTEKFAKIFTQFRDPENPKFLKDKYLQHK